MGQHEAAIESRPRRRNGFLNRDWLLALSLAFATGVAVWFGRSIKDFFAPSAASVLVPALTGTTESDALNEINRRKLKATVVARQPSDRYPKDVVMSQQPVAGAHVREGRAISLIISKGVNIFPMPDLRYTSLRETKLTLGRMHLPLVVAKVVPNEDIPANHVVSQDPLPLQSVREGSKVHVTLSKGPPAQVPVPNFTDKTVDEARRLAVASKTHIGQIVWTPFGAHGPARGIVVRQNPGPGAKIDPFSAVSLQVSAGPHEYGYLVRQVHASVRIPNQYDTARVRVEMRDDTGTWNVYDSYAQAGQRIDFNLTAVGTAELLTYVNNELLNQSVLGVEPPRPATTPPFKMPSKR